MEWALEMRYNVLPRRLLGVPDLLGDGAPGSGELGTVDEARLDETPTQELRASRAVEVHGGVAAAGLEVGEDGGPPADPVEVVYVEGDLRLGGQREEVEHGVGRAAARRDRRYGILERLAGEDVLRRQAPVEQIHDEPARLGAHLVFARVVGGGTRGA